MYLDICMNVHGFVHTHVYMHARMHARMLMHICSDILGVAGKSMPHQKSLPLEVHITVRKELAR